MIGVAVGTVNGLEFFKGRNLALSAKVDWDITFQLS